MWSEKWGIKTKNADVHHLASASEKLKSELEVFVSNFVFLLSHLFYFNLLIVELHFQVTDKYEEDS